MYCLLVATHGSITAVFKHSFIVDGIFSCIHFMSLTWNNLQPAFKSILNGVKQIIKVLGYNTAIGLNGWSVPPEILGVM